VGEGAKRTRTAALLDMDKLLWLIVIYTKQE